MTRFTKKVLSAFVDVGEAEAIVRPPEVAPVVVPGAMAIPTEIVQRFADYFDKLFSDANIPGPDYYEFSRMIEAMQAIADERQRYAAAFAGLRVQGLDKERLLATADEYLRVLTTDADRFRQTVETAMQEKVHSRSTEAEEKSRRIQVLSEEILGLQQQIAAMENEIAGTKEKLTVSSRGYTAEYERRRQQITADIQKMNQYI